MTTENLTYPRNRWTYDARRNVLLLREGCPGYEVDLDDLTPTEVVDWIHHIFEKEWSTPEIVAELAVVLSGAVIEQDRGGYGPQ